MNRSSAQYNIESLTLVAHRLAELCNEVIFVGGCITGLLITDKAAPDVRFTIDVDCIVNVITQPGYHALAKKLLPFPECSWHKDKPSDKNWLPYFASKATGDVIAAIAKKYPEIEFLTLCGHSHTRILTKISSNLEVRAGSAEYYRPTIQEIIEV